MSKFIYMFILLNLVIFLEIKNSINSLSKSKFKLMNYLKYRDDNGSSIR